jgi:hypothetical protein
MRMSLKIYYDSFNEGQWFKRLHPKLEAAELHPFPSKGKGGELLAKVLAYDRPDIVLTDHDDPILVVERTVEVPSGHNVGQRFARLAAAAQMRVPCVYFGPYAAYKHGGSTQGPRYMNLRLFFAIEKMAEVERAASTTVNWPVDSHYEIIKAASKDTRMRAYMHLFFENYRRGELGQLNKILQSSQFQREQHAERLAFIESEVENPSQYDGPPDSVTILPTAKFKAQYGVPSEQLPLENTVVYNVGMTYVRSDPYTGMAILYSYLYCGGMGKHSSHLVLHFPNITRAIWDRAAKNQNRKEVRLFLAVADGIVFGRHYASIQSLRCAV